MRYLATDGKIFDSRQACEIYEAELINYNAIDSAIITLEKEINIYIPVRKKVKIKSAIAEILTD